LISSEDYVLFWQDENKEVLCNIRQQRVAAGYMMEAGHPKGAKILVKNKELIQEQNNETAVDRESLLTACTELNLIKQK